MDFARAEPRWGKPQVDKTPANYRTPSFRDLQRQCAFLQGQVEELEARGAVQAQEAMETKLIMGRMDAGYAGLQAERDEQRKTARQAAERMKRDALALQQCERTLELTQNQAQSLQEQVGAAAAREAQLMSELSAARREQRETFLQLGQVREELRDTQAELSSTRNERVTVTRKLERRTARRETLHRMRS